jgi:protoporphyrinogen oxidase
MEKQGGQFYYDTKVIEISSEKTPSIKFERDGKLETGDFDAAIVTLPYIFFTKIAKLPENYRNKLRKLKGIGATNLILRLSKQFITNDTYWLSMCDLKSPILAIVEHTNFMDKKYYNDEHIVYLGNYMETSDPRFSMDEKELIELYDPWLKKINPNYRSSIIDYRLFRAPFAQPIITPNYSKDIPPLKTPLKNVYLANIEQVYPWDRGTNYAVELGKKVAGHITK